MIAKKVILLFFIVVILAFPHLVQASPGNNPIFATIAQVEQLISNAVSSLSEDINDLGDKVDQNEVDIEDLKTNDATISAKIEELEQRISNLENPPSPNPEPITISVDNAQIFNVPSGFKSMTIEINPFGGLAGWAPTVSFNNEATFSEQIRFGGSLSPVTIPVLSNPYRLNSGGPDGFSANITFNSEPDSEVLILGTNENYPFTSTTFNTDSFSSIDITVGGGNNPQNLTGISLQRFEGGIFVEKQKINCDGGAQCPLQTLPVLGSTYRVVVEGNGAGSVIGAILRK